jgi:hypothetical protein
MNRAEAERIVGDESEIMREWTLNGYNSQAKEKLLSE